MPPTHIRSGDRLNSRRRSSSARRRADTSRTMPATRRGRPSPARSTTLPVSWTQRHAPSALRTRYSVSYRGENPERCRRRDRSSPGRSSGWTRARHDSIMGAHSTRPRPSTSPQRVSQPTSSVTTCQLKLPMPAPSMTISRCCSLRRRASSARVRSVMSWMMVYSRTRWNSRTGTECASISRTSPEASRWRETKRVSRPARRSASCRACSSPGSVLMAWTVMPHSTPSG